MLRAIIKDVAGLLCLEEFLALASIIAFGAMVSLWAGMMSGAI